VALQVGSAYVDVGAKFDDDGFRRFDRAIDHARQQSRNDVEANARLDVDRRGFNRWGNELDGAERHAGKFRIGVGKQFGLVRGYMGGLAVAGVAGAGVFAKAIVGAASDVNESLTKNQVLFGKHSADLEQFAKTSARTYGISKKAALEYAGTFGNLFRALELGRKQSAGMSEDLIKLAADMASFNNASIDDTLEAIRSGLVGETEPLRRFGVNMNDATLRTEALRQGLVKNTKEALDPQTKALAAVALITKQTSNAHGDFARTSTGAANQTRILTARITDLGTNLGTKLLPYAQKALVWANKFLDEIEDRRGAGGKFRDTLEDIADKAKDAFEVLKDAGEWIGDHIELVKAAAAAWLAWKGALVATSAVARGRGLISGLSGAAAAAAGPGAVAATAGAAAGGSRVPAALRGAGPTLAVFAGLKVAQDFMTDKSDLGLLNQYADTLERVAKAGDSSGMRSLAAKMRETAQANSDITKGKHLEAFADALDKAADSGGQDLDALAGAFDKMAKSSGGDLERLRKEFGSTAGSARTNFARVDDATQESARQFRLMRRNTSGSLADVADVVRRNMVRIKDDLGDNSREGRLALARQFKLAADAIRDQVGRGEKLTREALQAIRGYLEQELQAYGLDLRQARNIVHVRKDGTATFGDPDANKGREGGAFRQGGGWLGRRGDVGPDVIPLGGNAWAAPGEADLRGPGGERAIANRHQIPYIDDALGIANELGFSPYGSLDELFAGVNRPHMYARGGRVYARGGIVPVPGFPGEEAAASTISRIVGLVHRYPGLRLTDAFDRDRSAGHKSPGHNVTGTAADFAGPDSVMNAAVKFLVSQGYLVGYDGRFGSADWPGHGPAGGQGGSNAHFHVEWSTGRGGGIPLEVKSIPRVGIRGGGAYGQVVQRALDVVRGSAQTVLRGGAQASLAIPVAGGVGGGGGSVGANKSIARRLLRAYGWGMEQFGALDRLWTGESGWDENAVNQSSGAGGIPQALPASKMGAGWQGNALQQIRWGLGYIKGRYGSPMAALSAWLSRSPHWYNRGGNTHQGKGRAESPAAKRKRLRELAKLKRARSNADLRNLASFVELFEQQATLAELTPRKDDDLYWLRAAESGYKQLIHKYRRRQRYGDAADMVGSLQGVQGRIEELLAPSDEEAAAAAGPDTQWMTDRAVARADALQADLAGARSSLAAFGSSGDIGAGGLNAFGAAAREGATTFGTGRAGAGDRPSIIYVAPQVLVPGSAETLAAVGGAVATALDSQGYRPNNRETVG
jgi:hypothetical protein